MKISRLGSDNAVVTAELFVNKRNGKKYYNLRHGFKGKNTWVWYACLDANSFDVDGREIALDGADYYLDPIIRDGEVMTNPRGEVCYNLTKTTQGIGKNDRLVLWYPDCRGYVDVKCNVSGKANVIGNGTFSLPGQPSEVYPAPVVILYGNSELHWSGIDDCGKQAEQVIKYNYELGTWDFGDVITTDS